MEKRRGSTPAQQGPRQAGGGQKRATAMARIRALRPGGGSHHQRSQAQPLHNHRVIEPEPVGTAAQFQIFGEIFCFFRIHALASFLPRPGRAG